MKKNANDFKIELNNIKNKQQHLESEISNTLQKYCGIYPDAIIDIKHGVNIKSKTINNPSFMHSLPIDVKLKYLNAIEFWIIENVHSTKQMEIPFNGDKHYK